MRKHPTKITEKEIESILPEILSLALSGYSILQISSKTQITPSIVRKYVNALRPVIISIWIKDAKSKAKQAVRTYHILDTTIN